MKRFGIIAALMLTTFASNRLVRAADAVNPLFTAWAKFGVGSSETLDGTVESAAGPMTTSTVTKLLEKADDHVVVETTTTVKFGTNSRSAPAKKTTIEKDADAGKQMKEIGTESVTAAGKTFKCKIYTAASPNPSAQTTSKMWSSSEVPGGLVKVVITGKVKVEQILKAFEIK